MNLIGRFGFGRQDSWIFDRNILKVPDFSLEFEVDRCSKGEFWMLAWERA